MMHMEPKSDILYEPIAVETSAFAKFHAPLGRSDLQIIEI